VKGIQVHNSFGNNFHAVKMVFKPLLIVLFLVTNSRCENLFQDALVRLENYDYEISVLSWPYNEQNKDILSEENLLEWNPVIIAIQNITKGEYRELRQANDLLATNYEESGIDSGCMEGADDVICNPILYKGDRFEQVDDEEVFTGVNRTKFGQVSWTQLKMHGNLENRKKRDFPSEIGKGFEGLFKILRKGGEERKENKDGCKNQPGAVFVLNGNLKEGEKSENFKKVLKYIYSNLMCRRVKRTILVGNIGWKHSQDVIGKFRRGSFKHASTSFSNVNQIWSHDFNRITGTDSDIVEYDGKDAKQPIKERFIAPSFVAFHHSMIKNIDKTSEI